jgi:hypothetical protein
MGYDEKKDKLIKLFEYDNGNGFLQVSIFSYNNSNAKIQMNRRYQKKDGTYGYGQLGRINKDEFEFLTSKSNEILELME